jgi:hypothetical protein
MRIFDTQIYTIFKSSTLFNVIYTLFVKNVMYLLYGNLDRIIRWHDSTSTILKT